MDLPKIIMNQPWNPYVLCGRAPICCVQAEIFSKLNSIKKDEVERDIIIYWCSSKLLKRGMFKWGYVVVPKFKEYGWEVILNVL